MSLHSTSNKFSMNLGHYGNWDSRVTLKQDPGVGKGMGWGIGIGGKHWCPHSYIFNVKKILKPGVDHKKIGAQQPKGKSVSEP